MEYSPELAQIHHDGFGFHADACAPAILDLLAPVRTREGLVVEVGCGSGLLTRYLVDAGLRVIASDASPAMLALCRENVPDAEDHALIRVPSDPLPPADAIVSTGHALSYLPDQSSLLEALQACAQALQPGGVMALDLEDLSTVGHQMPRGTSGWVGDDWMLVIERVSDGPDHFARVHHRASRQSDGSYVRAVERHDNVLIDVEGQVRPVLEAEGLQVTIAPSFGSERNMAGLMVVIAHRPEPAL